MIIGYEKARNLMRQLDWKMLVTMTGEELENVELFHPKQENRYSMRRDSAKRLISECCVIGHENDKTAIMGYGSNPSEYLIETVTLEEYEIELDKLRQSIPDGVEVFEMPGSFRPSPVQIGVNWATLGTVSPEEAIEYAKKILETAEAAKNFPYNGMIVTFS